jgi:hypothetical protein
MIDSNRSDDMADNISKVIEDTEAVVEEVDARYRAGTIDDKEDLRDARNDAYTARARARRRQIQGDVVVTDDDVAEMEGLRTEIEQAADTQAIIAGVGRVAGFVAQRFA